jgi:hypothetical protein
MKLNTVNRSLVFEMFRSTYTKNQGYWRYRGKKICDTAHDAANEGHDGFVHAGVCGSTDGPVILHRSAEENADERP